MKQPGEPANLLHTEASLKENTVADIELFNSYAKLVRDRGRAVGQYGPCLLLDERLVQI